MILEFRNHAIKTFYIFDKQSIILPETTVIVDMGTYRS